MKKKQIPSPISPMFSRRDFLKTLAVVGAGSLLAACGLKPSRQAVLRRPEILRVYPQVPSRVVRTRHTGVWKDAPQGNVADHDRLDTAILRQMLDTSIVELTGLEDARQAWQALFSPTEWIAIKVNTFGSSELWTRVPLALTVAQCLQEIGVPAEQIFIYDRITKEMENAGYSINRNQPGARCYGSDYINYSSGWQIGDTQVKLSNILLQCDALINIPVYKGHGIGGVSLALKNHYGTLHNPQDFHQPLIKRAIAELNALTPIKDRTRLVIGDVLAASTQARASRPYWTLDKVANSLLMSFDPVAHDAVGLQMLSELGGEGVFRWASRIANVWLKNAAELGVGTDDLTNIDLVERDLD